MVIRSREEVTTEVEEISKGGLEKGKIEKRDVGEEILKSAVEHDQKKIDSGKLVSEALNQGFSSFNPDMMLEKLKQDYSLAKHIYGESVFRLLSGYDPSYIKKNINIPEFQRELLNKMKNKTEEMWRDGILTKTGDIEESGIDLASVAMFIEELDNLNPKGLIGEKITKHAAHYGEKGEDKPYKKGERYRNIDLKKSIKLAIRRGHKDLKINDLKVYERLSKGSVNIIYAIDASGSMKGRKIEMAKKAGIALAYKAISSRDKVGLITFSTEIKEIVHPTLDFKSLIKKMITIKASHETNLTKTIEKSLEMFPRGDLTKHLILLTDAMPTIGKDPEKETLKLVSRARDENISISLIGINLKKKAKTFAEKIVKMGNGRLFSVKQAEELDIVVLEDYFSVV